MSIDLLSAYPFITVLPLLLMLVLVVATKKVFEPIIIATAVVFILSDGLSFITGFTDTVYDVFAEGTYPWIVLMLMLFGALIALLIRSGGIGAFRRFAVRYIKSERGSLVFTWAMGLILSIDDYINNLCIGPTIRELTDEHDIPREQVGFTISSVGVPSSTLVPLTAMAVFVFSIMQDYGVSAQGAGMLGEYIKVIPFMFYPIVIILVSLLLSLGVLPRVGAIRKYHRQIKNGTYALTDEEIKTMEGGDDKPIDEQADGSIAGFALPVITMIIVMIFTSDLVLALIISLAVIFALEVFRRKMTVAEYFETFFAGFKEMIFILAVVLMTFVFVHGLDNIGFSDYVVETVEPLLVGSWVPVLSFVTVGVVAFLGVDYWAAMLLFAPVALPLAEIFSVNPYMTMAAIVSGSVFGGSACFFAEQNLICSQAVERPPVRVALGGLPYSLLAFAITAALYTAAGFML